MGRKSRYRGGAKYANGNYKAQQKAYNNTKKGRQLITTSNQINRDKGTYGNRDNLDWAHDPEHKTSKNPKHVKKQKPSINRRSRLKIRK
jgi:hypothetical protein